MAVVEISSRGFRENQRAMFDLADNGDRIVIRRGRKRSYILTPIEDTGIEKELSPALISCIEEGMRSIREGEGHRYTTMEDLKLRLGL